MASRCKRHGAAVTLVEVLIAAGLGTMVLAGLYAMSRFGERTTGTTVVQADCLRRANLLVRHVRRMLQRSEAVLCPAPGDEASCLVVRGWNGAHQVVRLAPTHRHVLAVDESGERATCLVDLDDSPAFFAALTFATAVGGDLTVRVAFCSRSGDPVTGCASVVAHPGRAVHR